MAIDFSGLIFLAKKRTTYADAKDVGVEFVENERWVELLDTFRLAHGCLEWS